MLLVVVGLVFAGIAVVRLARTLETRQAIVLISVFIVLVVWLLLKLHQLGARALERITS